MATDASERWGPQRINPRELEGLERSGANTCARVSSAGAPPGAQSRAPSRSGDTAGSEGRSKTHALLFPALKHFQKHFETLSCVKKGKPPIASSARRLKYRTWIKGWARECRASQTTSWRPGSSFSSQLLSPPNTGGQEKRLSPARRPGLHATPGTRQPVPSRFTLAALHRPNRTRLSSGAQA